MIHFKHIGYYDWFDKDVNMTIYGQENAPLIDIYNQSKIPHVVFAGKQDNIVNIEDAKEVFQNLKNEKHFHEIDGEHVSFLIGKDMSYVQKMLEYLDKANDVSS